MKDIFIIAVGALLVVTTSIIVTDSVDKNKQCNDVAKLMGFDLSIVKDNKCLGINSKQTRQLGVL